MKLIYKLVKHFLRIKIQPIEFIVSFCSHLPTVYRRLIETILKVLSFHREKMYEGKNFLVFLFKNVLYASVTENYFNFYISVGQRFILNFIS
jgi:hypothetical protein